MEMRDAVSSDDGHCNAPTIEYKKGARTFLKKHLNSKRPQRSTLLAAVETVATVAHDRLASDLTGGVKCVTRVLRALQGCSKGGTRVLQVAQACYHIGPGWRRPEDT
jgi:hypothetical protein